jgi:hypothetical protein
VHRHPVSSLESVRLFLSGLKTAGLGRKILWGKDLAARYSVFKEPFLTAFAGAILSEFEMRRKVRCHTGELWKTVGVQKSKKRLAFVESHPCAKNSKDEPPAGSRGAKKRRLKVSPHPSSSHQSGRSEECMAPVDFRAALKRQINFLASSCQGFDAGFHDEAIRIAQCIRVLLHDTRNQTSVLTHLNAKGIALTSTCLDIAAEMRPGARALVFNGMGRFATGPDARYFPKLGNGRFRYDLPVDRWWMQTVFILDPDTWVSRRDIVLSAADKDGGSHVDAALTPTYLRLVESGDLGFFVDERGTQTNISGHHYVALRQMGHEVLDSPALVALAN